MKEQWKSIKGYDGLYEVSDLGNVRSLKYGKVRVLKPGPRKGYLAVQLCKNGKVKACYVHRLVVEAFRGPIPPGMQVNHLNEDKTDNRLSNLEVVTAKENINWGTRNERATKSKKIDLIEAGDPFTKLTFKNSIEAASYFHCNRSTVRTLIYQARKRGRDWINLRGTKYYFSKEE